MSLPVPTIRDCQRKLQEAAFRDGLPDPLPKFGADNRGGVETRDAILAFQARRNLRTTGKLDAPTVNALWEEPQLLRTLESPIGKAALALLEFQLRRTLVFQALEGKKTYIVLVVGAITILVNHFFGPIPGIGLDPNQWLVQLGALVPAATIRAAISKGPTS